MSSGGLMRRVLAWIFRLVLGLVVGSVVLVVLFRVVRPPMTSLMLIRTGEALAAGRPPAMTHDWIALADVSPAVLRAVIAAEDARFFEHAGIDLDALWRAYAYNERHGGRELRGGSTITMQCARNVFLWPGRTYVRKAFEAYFAVLLELLWGKRRILEVYVNVVEWGNGVYGVAAAARRAFGVPASSLTAEQAALLAAVLPNPRRWNPAAPTRYVVGRAAQIRARAASVRLDGLGLGEEIVRSSR